MARHFLLGEVATILGRRPHQITYLITSGQVPEPERRLANKRLFTELGCQRGWQGGSRLSRTGPPRA